MSSCAPLAMSSPVRAIPGGYTDTRRPPMQPRHLTAPTSDPHRQLHDLLQHSAHHRSGRWSPSVKASALRALFTSIWQSEEWLAYFDVLEERKPAQWGLGEWLGHDETGRKAWKLSEHQARMREKRGKEREEVPKQGRMCGKTLHRYDRTYTCKTCAMDPSCILCVDCFRASDHEGHEVLFGQSFTFSAACDCGDTSAWKDNGHLGCAHHPPLPSGSRPAEQPVGVVESDDVPPELIRAMYETVCIVVEFIIQVFQHSLLPSEFGKLPKDEEEMRMPESSTGEAKERRGKGPWAVVLWSDDKHVAGEITRQIRDALDLSWDIAERCMREIDEVGRKVMISTSNTVLAFHTASMFQQIELSITLRPATDVFKEELAGVLIGWLADMGQCTIGGDRDLFTRILAKALYEPRQQRGDVGPGTPLAPELKELEWNAIGTQAKRIDWIMRLDIKMWKRTKFEWRQIYACLYGLSWETQRELASRFSFNYVHLFEHFLFQDREIDTNLMYCIAYMVFGNGPACAWATTRQHLFTLVLDVAQAWFTNQIVTGRLVIPPLDFDADSPRHIVEETAAFRSKKGLTVFGHLRSLVRHEEMQRIIARSPAMFTRAAGFLNLFVGMQTQKKEINEHIEFEVDWTKTFAYLGELAKTSRELGESLKFATPDDLLSGLFGVANRVYDDLTLRSSVLDPSKYTPPNFKLVNNVLIPGSQCEIIDVDVSTIEAFSFHHYMNLLFAECLKHLRHIPSDFHNLSLPDFFHKVVLDNIDRTRPEQVIAILVELPMQKHAVLSQIKADLWRKNGIGMRGQMHHYRDVGIREATIDQEFWTLQFGLCVMDPVQFFVTLIDRFDLTTLFRGDVLEPEIWEDDQAEPRQRVMLLEDFMLLTLNLATDTATAMDWSQERSTRFHIIQQLAINTFTYSELTKRLPERVLDHSFLHILAEVADFREPTETVVGAYSLKPEYLDEVNPYWRHYTRNDMRSVADKILARKKKLEPATDPFITPRLELPGHNSPFHGIRGWLHSSVIAQIIHYALAHCIPIADPSEWPGLQFMRNDDGMPQFDLLLDLTLHLAMVALQAAPETFAESSIEIIEQANSMSTFQNLWFMQTNEAFKPFHPKVNFILEQIVANLPPDYTQDYRAQRAEELVKLEQKAKAEQTKPDPREAAAARQKKIMAEFAKKQADFVAAFDEESDEEEDIAEEAVECYGQCIVCQDDVTVKNTGGLLALIQPNRVIREVVNDRDWFEESLLAPSCLDGATRYHRYGLGSSGEPTSTDGYPSSNNRFGVYVSACSHLMHESCINRYFDATRSRHTQQVQRHHPENAVRCEYLCPLCKSLGNVLIPLDPTQANLKPYIPTSTRGPPGRPPSLSEKIRDVSSEGLLKVRDSAKIWEHHVETGELTPWFSDTNFSAASLDPAYRRQIRLTARMIERFRFLVRPLSEQSQRIRGKKTHMYVPDDIVSYTVSACEIAQRGLQTPGQTVAEQVPEISMTLIKKLIGMLQLELDIFFGPSYDRTALRVGMFARFLPDWYRASTLPSPLLLRQPLVLVVEAAAIAPDLLQAVIVMAYYAELTRTMLGLSMWVRRCLGNRQQPQPRTSPPADSHLADALSVFSGFRPIMQSILRNNAGPFTDSESVLALLSDEMLAKLLYSHTLPFLRRATIIFHATAGAYPVSDPSIIVTEGCEYRRLLSLLGIVPPLETLSNPHSTESPIIARWLTQWAMQGRIVPQLEYPGTYELARLSLRWEDLMIRYQDHRCDKCGTKPSYPALCLYCGNFVCLGGDCCSEGELGECNIHMRDCGAATGMFVDIKRWLLIYLYAGSGSFGHMPYLDSHGELDISMRRMHRQYMHLGRMDELRRATWLQHTIPHLTARKLELTTDAGGWGTF